MSDIKYQAGTIMPWEYDWQEQFRLDKIQTPYCPMDVGKVRGLAIAYQQLKDQLSKYREVVEAAETFIENEDEPAYPYVCAVEDLKQALSQLKDEDNGT